jgi:transposase
MDVLYARCAGLDVHQKTVVACARIASETGPVHLQRVFGTTTRELLALGDWLAAQGCTHVVMEATGVYWKPIWHTLEGQCELILANAMHVRNIPGRKTDITDATWLSDLLAHGLIRGSFVPPPAVGDLRDLTRTRTQLVREAARHSQRIQKVLEDAHLKLATVVSDILGVSGRAILTALIAGERDPDRLADLTRGRLKASRAEIIAALHGRCTEHHCFLLKVHLTQIDTLQHAVADVEARIGERLAPFQRAAELLNTIPGVSDTVARVLIAEIGIDMSRFPTAGHLISWAGLCPRMDESAGKRRSTRTRHTGCWLKTTLVQAAWAAVRTRDSYLRAQFLRLKTRRGPKKAILAVAASMLTAIYHMLLHDLPYKDLGSQYFDRRDKTRVAQRLIRRLEDLGIHVEITAPAA